MRVTQEADYAIRICLVLDSEERKVGAAEIAEIACITQKFALKILRKLCEVGLIKSYKGACGGYELTRSGEEIKVLEVIEAIDGPMRISKCLDCDYECSRNSCKFDCKMHIAFGAINKKLVDNFGLVTVRMLHDENMSAADIADIINSKK